MTTEKQQWGSRLGVILAVAGSAVGLGNFLRFPGLVSQNGGGAFMIPYFVALLLVGIPVGWAEWTMARYGGRKGFHSAPGIYGVIGGGRWARYIGMLGVLVPLVVCLYYVVIEAWCLQYFFRYLLGEVNLGSTPDKFVGLSQALFNGVSGNQQDGAVLAQGISPSLLCLGVALILNLYLVARGLSGGIEKFCNIAMPVMALCALGVLIRVLTLGTPDPSHPERSVVEGLGFMWNPDLSKLARFDTWMAAAGQIFFSLSVGFGVVINYASYLKKKDDVLLSGLAASATNELFEVVFGGLITIPAAFIFLGASGAIGGTFGLGFNTLPVVFAHMGGVGRWVGAIWFLLLALAAITSSLSMLQPVLAFLEEALALNRRRAVAIVGIVLTLGSAWVLYFSKGLLALDTMDFWVGTMMIFVLGTFQSILFAWVFGIDRGLTEAQHGARMKLPPGTRTVMAIVSPIYLIIVFVGFCWQNLPGYIKGLGEAPVARWTLLLVLGVVGLVSWVTVMGERRWRAVGMDLDGRLPPQDELKGTP